MYNISTIITEFLPLIGWALSDDPSETMNPMGDLLTASSGTKYNDVHPLLTIDNLRKIAPIFEDHTYGTYSALTSYSKDKMVKSGSDYYVSLTNANLGNALNNTTYWRQTNPFNEWLRNKTIGGITKVLSDWIAMKGKLRTAHNLLKREQVLDIPGYQVEDFSSKDYIGWRLVPLPFPDVVLKIKRLSIHMSNSENCSVKIYKNGVYQESVSFTGTGTSAPIWKAVDITIETGNVYYVVVDRSALTTAAPINGIANMVKPWLYNRFPGIYPFAEVSAFEHDGPGEDGWDDVSGIITNQNNYGFNMVLTATCDYTNFLVDQKDLFVPAIRLSTGMSLLREIAYNPNARINRKESNVDDLRILFEIDGDTLGRAGSLKKEYDAILNLISFDDKQFSSHCLPCRRSGMRIKSM